MWGSSVIATALVVSVWFVSFKQDVKQLSGAGLVNLPQEIITTTHYLNIESAEIKDNRTYLYFSIKNDTANILNFSDPSNIEFSINKQIVKPASITDRQAKPFAQKILSNSQNFGILVFNQALSGRGDISFNNLAFEQGSGTIFKEVITVDLSKLRAPYNLGN